jgi:vancomycin aglycone glucosyltransferase
MRVLLSTIGSRGDVQPLVALALQLRKLGQDVHLCAPPDFREWVEGLGISITPIGPELRKMTVASVAPTPTPLSPETLRQMTEAMIASQFKTITEAAQGCDLILGATGLQVATRSVAEQLGVPYFFTAFCPAVLPSPHHAPPVYGVRGQVPALATADNRDLWARDAAVFNESFAATLNSHRAGIGLPPVGDVRDHIFTGHPWLAADPILAPWPDPSDQAVFQTGAWILPDERPLSPGLEAFIEAGEPPIYFGFGSSRAPQGLSQVMVQTARALGRRALISAGWAGLSLVDNEPDCLAIGEVNQQTLFKRVAAVVHHGGAGTTTAAARAGAPQVIIPQGFDQHYWARRVQTLGIGTAHAPGTSTTDSLTRALKHTLRPDAAARAKSIAAAMRGDGAEIAARRLIDAAPQN